MTKEEFSNLKKGTKVIFKGDKTALGLFPNKIYTVEFGYHHSHYVYVCESGYGDHYSLFEIPLPNSVNFIIDS